MGSVLIEKLPIINKALFKKVCRIMVNNSTHFIYLIIFFYYTQFQKGHFASGQFMVVQRDYKGDKEGIPHIHPIP